MIVKSRFFLHRIVAQIFSKFVISNNIIAADIY